MRVGYLGPEGTFSHEAVLAATTDSELEPVALPTIYDAVMAVHDGAVERALVPIENSLEGSVNATLDSLAHLGDAVSQEILAIAQEVGLLLERLGVVRGGRSEGRGRNRSAGSLVGLAQAAARAALADLGDAALESRALRGNALRPLGL